MMRRVDPLKNADFNEAMNKQVEQQGKKALEKVEEYSTKLITIAEEALKFPQHKNYEDVLAKYKNVQVAPVEEAPQAEVAQAEAPQASQAEAVPAPKDDRPKGVIVLAAFNSLTRYVEDKNIHDTSKRQADYLKKMGENAKPITIGLEPLACWEDYLIDLSERGVLNRIRQKHVNAQNGTYEVDKTGKYDSELAYMEFFAAVLDQYNPDEAEKVKYDVSADELPVDESKKRQRKKQKRKLGYSIKQKKQLSKICLMKQ